MKVLFFGSGDFGIPSLERLKGGCHELLGVVTSADRPQGRGRQILPSPVKAWALENSVRVIETENANSAESLKLFASLGADLFAVVSFGTILSREFLRVPRLGSLNAHPSLLPKYRGATPVQQALLDGEEVTGTTILGVSEKLDAGDIYLQKEIRLLGDESAGEVWERLSLLSGDLLAGAVDAIAAGRARPVPQDEACSSVCRKLKAADAFLNWRESARRLHNRVRALSIWPGTVSALGGRKIGIVSTGCDDQVRAAGEPGTVLFADAGRGIGVATGEGVLRIRQLKPESRRVMSAGEFLNGCPVKAGERFGA